MDNDTGDDQIPEYEARGNINVLEGKIGLQTGLKRVEWQVQ